jgi:hypothetical protein
MKKTFTAKSICAIISTVFLSLSLAAQNTIKTDSLIQLSTCAGGSILVRYTATGTYPAGNKFIAQLSDRLGEFNDPVDIGQIGFNTGYILGTIPKSANFSIFYKIRVISTNPSTIGSASPNTLIVTQIAELNKIIAYPNDTICRGDSVKLTALNFADSYKWSTGDTTKSITVKKGGIYSVTTKDLFTCQSVATLTITVNSCSSGISENNLDGLFIYPNPASHIIHISGIATNQKKSYQLFNGVGQLEKEGVIDGSAIDIADLHAGIHFIRVTAGETYTTIKFIKQ